MQHALERAWRRVRSGAYTVLSIFWRCFSSAWLKQPQMEDWVRSVLHSSLVYGKGGDPQVAAVVVLQSFAECGYCASLDYTKCFDLVRPEVPLLCFRSLVSTVAGKNCVVAFGVVM